ncbi:hypothetical protein FRC15_007421, partial [Serendipita sp. 397]
SANPTLHRPQTTLQLAPKTMGLSCCRALFKQRMETGSRRASISAITLQTWTVISRL